MKLYEEEEIDVVSIPGFLFYCKKNDIVCAQEIKEITVKLLEKDF